MTSIRFDARPRADVTSVIEIVPVIDGAELTDLVHAFELQVGMETRTASYGGLIPAHFDFGPIDAHFLGASTRTRNGKPALLGCECGEAGCWPFLARVVANETCVIWSEFEQPYRKERDYSGFGPFSFARQDYESALLDLVEALRLQAY